LKKYDNKEIYENKETCQRLYLNDFKFYSKISVTMFRDKVLRNSNHWIKYQLIPTTETVTDNCQQLQIYLKAIQLNR